MSKKKLYFTGVERVSMLVVAILAVVAVILLVWKRDSAEPIVVPEAKVNVDTIRTDSISTENRIRPVKPAVRIIKQGKVRLKKNTKKMRTPQERNYDLAPAQEAPQNK